VKVLKRGTKINQTMKKENNYVITNPVLRIWVGILLGGIGLSVLGMFIAAIVALITLINAENCWQLLNYGEDFKLILKTGGCFVGAATGAVFSGMGIYAFVRALKEIELQEKENEEVEL